jgi:hypothetical protein
VAQPYRGARGGSWLIGATALFTASRYEYAPIDRFDKGGVRCARIP